MQNVSIDFTDLDLRHAEEACRYLANWYQREAERECVGTVKHALTEEAREVKQLADRLKHARYSES